jgi:transcriptional regulator with XRE-family HTH domain
MSESDNIGPTESPFQIFNAESFGHALRHYRRSAGLTQAEFAEMAGLRQSQISELESGKMTAQTRRLVTLLKLLGVKIILLKETQ